MINVYIWKNINNMKFKTILVSSLLFPVSIFAQDWDYNEEKDSVFQNKVEYINTKKVDDLLDKKKRINSSINLYKAYRIQLFSGSRSGSTSCLTKFKKQFPSIPAETSYDQPYFKTKVGVYRTKLEAKKALLTIKKQFKSAFIYVEKVTLDKL